ncbi:MAG TPA: glycosyltransferase family 4 protein [Tepidisphaeraceae bacterium]|jgi:glycosyltransferase involved in cell wall biosynthesis
MKIVHIITRLIVGGAQENTLLSCRGQHESGHDVTLITGPALGPEGSLLEFARSHGYRIEIIPDMRRAILPIRDWKTYRQLIGLLKQIKPDIVHTHSSKAGILGRHAAHAAHMPAIIHTIHGLAFTASKNALVNHAYKILEKRAAPITTKIVCVADAMREQSLAAGIGRPAQYVTVHSGMEIEPFINSHTTRAAIRKQLGIAENDIVVGTIARLFHLKGHEDLLAGAPQLCEKFPNLKFLWLGDGILRPQFEARMREMKLTDRFILTGMIPPSQVARYVGAMDILAHPSRREGLARALPQGQLAGIPVVTYDIDGNREGLIPGESGILIPAFDTVRFINALATLAADANVRQQMGAIGQKFAAERFDWRIMVQRLNVVYEQALSK